MLGTSFRTLAALFLAVVVCASFLAFLVISQIRSSVLEPTFYTTVLEENNSYEVIHTGLLEEIESQDEVEQLKQELGMESDDFQKLASEIVPISYLKAQIDGVIFGILNYLRGETEEPQVFIELGMPLEQMRLVALDYVDSCVESVERTNPTTPEEYAEEAQVLIQHLERGEIPATVPSLANIPRQPSRTP